MYMDFIRLDWRYNFSANCCICVLFTCIWGQSGFPEYLFYYLCWFKGMRQRCSFLSEAIELLFCFIIVFVHLLSSYNEIVTLLILVLCVSLATTGSDFSYITVINMHATDCNMQNHTCQVSCFQRQSHASKHQLTLSRPPLLFSHEHKNRPIGKPQ